MATIKEERASSSSRLSDNVQNMSDASLKDDSRSVADRKRSFKARKETAAPTEVASRKSSRRRVTPKTYSEDVDLPSFSRQPRDTWKDDELERLLDCLKTYKCPDRAHSVKKHVKTKNIRQIEAKIDALRKRAVDKALEETIGMPPLQCWENLAHDINRTMNDESHREISKVFRTAISEPSASTDTQASRSDPNQPNYTRINLFLATLLRGVPAHELNDLSPIDAMVVLECLNNTIEFLQHTDVNEHVDFLRERYTHLYYKLYSPSSLEKSSSSSASKVPGPSKTSSSQVDDETLSDVSGLGTLNPFNIPVDKVNLIRPEPCGEHGNRYCSAPACRNRHAEKQKTSVSSQ